MECKKATTREDIEFCKDAILEFLRNLNPATAVDQVFEMITNEGYELVFIPNADNTRAGAFIGYRILNLLRTGPSIYIDDLFTFADSRNQGFAGMLLDYVESHAAAEGFKSIHLDSGFILHTAHRLYHNKGYNLACHHFFKPLNQG
jgi:GNAT superfamily N-acetyltransferase